MEGNVACEEDQEVFKKKNIEPLCMKNPGGSIWIRKKQGIITHEVS